MTSLFGSPGLERELVIQTVDAHAIHVQLNVITCCTNTLISLYSGTASGAVEEQYTSILPRSLLSMRAAKEDRRLKTIGNSSGS